LVNARSLLEKRPKAFKLIETRPEDSPLAVQLFGSVPEEMRDAAVIVQERGAVSVDINMGCPVRKVCQVGGGSAMMTQHDKTTLLVRMMVNAVNIPVTAKMRLGWDDQNITAPDLARALEDAGVAAICAGVSIGRGAFYDPWIFKRTLDYIGARTGSPLPAEPSFAERVRVMCRHFDLMIEIFGEELGCRMFRKIAPWYAKRFGPCHEFNKKVVHVATKAQFLEVLENYQRWRQQFLDGNGELLPRFAPAPMVASFMREPDEFALSQIAVPKGPVEVW
jgi:tRNA-dihydrouridine synthase